MAASDLSNRHCTPLDGDTAPLTREQAEALMHDLHGDWAIDTTGKEINRSFKFRNYYQTMAFVNAMAWVAHAQDHHPDIEVGYNRCLIRYSTIQLAGCPKMTLSVAQK